MIPSTDQRLEIRADIDSRMRDRILELGAHWDIPFAEAVERIIAAGLEHTLTCGAMREQQSHANKGNP